MYITNCALSIPKSLTSCKMNPYNVECGAVKVNPYKVECVACSCASHLHSPSTDTLISLLLPDPTSTDEHLSPLLPDSTSTDLLMSPLLPDPLQATRCL